MRAVLVGLFLLLPWWSEAAVSISEVAWMGSDESANYEWIELNNDGPETDVTGWVVTDSMNLEIELAGIIPANKHVVLERTSDVSAPGTAFLIYTGALVNTGATLKLTRADGSLIDQVAGGENWENIGGDNTTKETAQYTSHGWKTAPATPGSALIWSEELDQEPVEAEVVTKEANTSQKTTTKKQTKSGETVRLTLPDVTLSLEIGAQKVGYVHQPIAFAVEPSGIGETLIDSLSYQWNFGDGFTATQKDPQHVFDYPGTYVVTVHGIFRRQEQVSRHEITILPVKVSLTTNRKGDVQVNNDSPYELDISGYRLLGEETFVFPAYSILLPNQTVTIPKTRLGRTEERMVAIYDTEADLVSSIGPKAFVQSATLATETEAPNQQLSALSYSQQADPVPLADFTFAPVPMVSEEKPVAIEEELVEEQVAEVKVATSTQIASVGGAVPESNSRMGYLALVGVLGLGVLGIYATPRRNEKS